MSKKTINIVTDIQNISYAQLLQEIENNILENKQLLITYCNAQTCNLCHKFPGMQKIIAEFNIIHPDGFGIFFASKFLYGRNGFQNRLTGSAFYQLLLEKGIKRNWKFFFFGDKDETLKEISSVHPELMIAGCHNGYTYENGKLLSLINDSKPDILIVGMGSPKQEDWIINFKSKLDVKIILAVGDGIKVFSGSKKRGTGFIQKIGLEWMVRLFFEPKRLWRRYLVGNPLFLIRIIKCKFSKTI